MFVCVDHRRINREEKAKVVNAILGGKIYSIPCRGSCFALGRFEEYCRMNRTRMIEEKYDFIIFFNIVQYKIARVARTLINSVPHVQYIHKSELVPNV